MFGRDFPTHHNMLLFSELSLNLVQRIRSSGRNGVAAAHEIFVGAGALGPIGNCCLSGDLQVQSEGLGKGAAFILELPRQPKKEKDE